MTNARPLNLRAYDLLVELRDHAVKHGLEATHVYYEAKYGSEPQREDVVTIVGQLGDVMRAEEARRNASKLEAE